MNVLILFFVSVAPVLAVGTYIYKKDKNKESTKLLIKLFLGGILSCFLVLFVSSILISIFPIFAEEPLTLNLLELIIRIFIGVALVEEVCKWIIVYNVSYNHTEFEEIYDMIVYSAFVALGFACFENLLYVFENGLMTGLIRAVTAVPGHACDGVFMGYYLGLAKLSAYNNRKDLAKKYILFSILVPTVAHGIYDYCLFTGNIFFIMFFFVFVILLYIFAIRKINRLSSINKKMYYKDKFCPNCNKVVEGNYCSECGRKNE